jgi:hypothetical protein
LYCKWSNQKEELFLHKKNWQMIWW